jgi:leader peptidase (prepilin peptidase) / N-methyltransferase
MPDVPYAPIPWLYALLICAIALTVIVQPWLWRRIFRLWHRDRRAIKLALPLARHKRLWPWLTGLSGLLMVFATFLAAYAGRADAPTTVALLALASLCTMLCLMDWRCYWLPDSLVYGLAVAGFVASFGMGQPWWMPIIGFACGYGFLAVTAWAYRTFRGVDGLGGGDIKLAGAMGAWIGPFDLPFVLTFASVFALLAGVALAWGSEGFRAIRISFGSYLALALLLAVTLQHSFFQA